jgi:Fe2+ or Zn2+ uptake regulation protein
MPIISKQLLKEEIDRLDNQHLELVYKILQQFPHEPIVERISLRNSVLHYTAPTEPVAIDDWDALQ